MSSFNEHVARRLRDARIALSREWLKQLSDILPVDERDIFPSEKLLDHVPALLEEIAAYLSAPAENAVEVSSPVLHKAGELGRLRHEQNASVHQILREFDILTSILEGFAVGELNSEGIDPNAAEAVDVVRRINRAMRVLMQATVDTFISEYSATIGRQRQHLEDFNRMLSHEMRGPMNTLRIVAALLAEKDAATPEERKTLIDLIQGSVDRTYALLVGLEALAGFRRDDSSPAIQEVDLGGSLRNLADQLGEAAAANAVEITIVEPTLTVTLDIGKLELAVTNLIGNAIKYCDPGKPARWVRVESRIDDAGRLEVVVSDNGVGIDGEDLPRIFDRFFRGRRAGVVPGTGLGLVIVHECVHSLGGEIDADSAVGEGTRFTIRIPLV